MKCSKKFQEGLRCFYLKQVLDLLDAELEMKVGEPSVDREQCLICKSESAGMRKAYESGGVMRQVQLPERVQKTVLKHGAYF